MADIDIQKKKGPPILPIILGVLALLALVAAVLLLTGDDEEQTAVAPGVLPQDTVAEQQYPPAPPTMPMSVQTFRQQCGDASQFGEAMGMAHERAAECIRQMAQGLDDVVRRDTVADQPLQQRMELLRQRAEQVVQDPQATDHAQRVRTAALEAAEIIGYIADNREGAGADLQRHAQQTRQAAEQMNVDTMLLEQREQTATFFARVADALEAMAQGTVPQPR